MTHLDVKGRAEKTCNWRPENVKDVGSIFILDIFFNHVRVGGMSFQRSLNVQMFAG